MAEPVSLQSVYPNYIEPIVHKVHVAVAPYISQVEAIIGNVGHKIQLFESSFLGSLEKMQGKQVADVAARILAMSKELFPELIAWMTALSGRITVSLLIESFGVISKFVEPLKTLFVSGDVEASKKQALEALVLTKNQCFRGAFLTSLVAGGLFFIKGILALSGSDIIRGVFYTILGLSGKEVLLGKKSAMVDKDTSTTSDLTAVPAPAIELLSSPPPATSSAAAVVIPPTILSVAEAVTTLQPTS